MTTVAEINAALRAAGKAERLVRGRGFFYFAGGSAPTWPQSGVYAWSLDHSTAAEWVAERDRLAAARAGSTDR